jgi:hypothetical protein
MKQVEINLAKGMFGQIFNRLNALELSVGTLQADLSALEATIAALPPTLTQTEVETIISDWIANSFPTFVASDVPEYQP